MFYFDDFYGKKVLKSTFLADYDCFFTTRDFVLTPANRDDLIETANLNRQFLEKKLNNKITSAKQIHSDNIAKVNKEKNYYEDTDALISDIENSILLMNFADCVPIILYSKKHNIGAIVHAGWRGTQQEIVRKTVEKMNIPTEKITALIGPSIGKCCFETDKEVFEKLIKNKNQTDLYEEKNNKFFIDLKKLNYEQLIKIGVKDIDVCSYCTCCMSDIFFSYRKEKGITARHSAIVKIKGDIICQ
ncbi:MAG: peptidoglycan editing factor PgeF [Cyanobacteria bacterium SIG29]|nr:peptidoglycan editing factor PgeF [Cyanobacteria bacterium SIG29]